MPRALSLSQQPGQAAQERFCWLEKQQRTGATWLTWAHRTGVGQTAGKGLQQGVPSQPGGRSRKGHQERAGKSRAQPCICIQTFPAAPGQLQAAEHPSPPSDGPWSFPSLLLLEPQAWSSHFLGSLIVSKLDFALWELCLERQGAAGGGKAQNSSMASLGNL